MHRLRSKIYITRFRVTALLFCVRSLLIPLAVAVLISSILFKDKELAMLAIGLGCLAILVTIIQWIMAQRVRCPLCLTPVLAVKGCSKHRNARTFLGSYRLRVALAILFGHYFHCPYCHEPTAMEVRDRRG